MARRSGGDIVVFLFTGTNLNEAQPDIRWRPTISSNAALKVHLRLMFPAIQFTTILTNSSHVLLPDSEATRVKGLKKLLTHHQVSILKNFQRVLRRRSKTPSHTPSRSRSSSRTPRAVVSSSHSRSPSRSRGPNRSSSSRRSRSSSSRNSRTPDVQRGRSRSRQKTTPSPSRTLPNRSRTPDRRARIRSSSRARVPSRSPSVKILSPSRTKIPNRRRSRSSSRPRAPSRSLSRSPSVVTILSPRDRLRSRSTSVHRNPFEFRELSPSEEKKRARSRSPSIVHNLTRDPTHRLSPRALTSSSPVRFLRRSPSQSPRRSLLPQFSPIRSSSATRTAEVSIDTSLRKRSSSNTRVAKNIEKAAATVLKKLAIVQQAKKIRKRRPALARLYTASSKTDKLDEEEDISKRLCALSMDALKMFENIANRRCQKPTSSSKKVNEQRQSPAIEDSDLRPFTMFVPAEEDKVIEMDDENAEGSDFDSSYETDDDSDEGMYVDIDNEEDLIAQDEKELPNVATYKKLDRDELIAKEIQALENHFIRLRKYNAKNEIPPPSIDTIIQAYIDLSLWASFQGHDMKIRDLRTADYLIPFVSRMFPEDREALAAFKAAMPRYDQDDAPDQIFARPNSITVPRAKSPVNTTRPTSPQKVTILQPKRRIQPMPISSSSSSSSSSSLSSSSSSGLSFGGWSI